MDKIQIENRIKELEEEFKKVKEITIKANNRLVQLQGAYTELKKLLDDTEEKKNEVKVE